MSFVADESLHNRKMASFTGNEKRRDISVSFRMETGIPGDEKTDNSFVTMLTSHDERMRF